MRMRDISPPDPEPVAGTDRASRVWAEIVFVSICHATNWDRLHEHILAIARTTPEQLSPGRLRQLDAEAFRYVFNGGFNGRVPGPDRRLKILRDLGCAGQRWIEEGWLAEIVEPGVQLAGPEGLYARLAEAACFREDPLAKKSRVLAHQLVRLGLVEPVDLGALAPAIDYHLIRLYLRTGRVRPASPDLMERLRTQGRIRLPQILRLREAVEEAMWYTAAGADLRIDWVNHIEWQVARSFCMRDAPRCQEGPLASKPLDQISAQLLGDVLGCPLAARCPARYENDLVRLNEPSLRASYY